jgi:hypothetical protein
MDLEAGLRAVGALAPLVQKSGQSPLALAGRLFGLGEAEMNAGIPKWAWAAVGLVAGATVMWVWSDEIKGWVKRGR